MKPAPKPRRERRSRKVIRLLGYLSFVCLLLAGLAARSAYGSAKRALLDVGRELGNIDGPPGKSPVRLNGQAIFVASSTEDAPLEEVLDRMEAQCRTSSAGLFADIDDLTARAKAAVPGLDIDRSAASGVLREDGYLRGFVACFAREPGAEPDSLSGLARRLVDVVETGDLSRLGRLRYLRAERLPDNRTHAVAVWTDGPFNLYSLFPEAGDAPGSDPPDAPRPPRSTRVLTASVEGAPYAVRVYDSAASASEVLLHYEAELPKRGFEGPVEREMGGGARGRFYHREGVDLYVVVQDEGGRAVVSLIEARSL
jgi:hypothetical protein